MSKKLISSVVFVVLTVGLLFSSSQAATIEEEIWVSPDEPYNYEFSVEKSGTIYAEASLEMMVEEPALTLEFLSTGEIEAVIWGKPGEQMSLRYIISERDLAVGTEWKISVKSGAGAGYIIIDYPTIDMIPPTAIISAIQTEIEEGESVFFSAEESSDPDGSIISYDWDFGDDDTDEGIYVEHAYSHSGIYVAVLTVTDNDGLTHSDRIEIIVNPPTVNVLPIGYIDIYPNPASEGEDVTFEGYGEDEDGEIVECLWTFPDGRTYFNSGSSSSFTLKSEEVQVGWYSFAVRDDDGAWSEEASVELEFEALSTIPWLWIIIAIVLVIAVPLILYIIRRPPPQIDIEIRGGIERMQ